ncbi:MAG: AAA family ATPase [bacterium]
MYKSVSIQNFRCYDSINIDKLKRINLFVGKNNVGKTTLLEAVYLLCARNNPDQSTIVNLIRGLEVDFQNLNSNMNPPWDYNFNNQKNVKEIVIEGEHANNGFQKVTIRSFLKSQSIFDQLGKDSSSLSADPNMTVLGYKTKVLEYEIQNGDKKQLLHVSLSIKGVMKDYDVVKTEEKAYFRAPHSKIDQKILAARLEPFLKNGQESLINVLRIIDQNINRIFITYENESPMVYCGLEDNTSIPLVFMGDGISSLIGIFTEIFHIKNGVYFIDEIENGFHYSAMEKIWLAIEKMAEESNVQIFATTHSRECVIAAFDAIKSSNYNDFYLHRLERVKGDIKCFTYDLETLESAIDLNLEVR